MNDQTPTTSSPLNSPTPSDPSQQSPIDPCDPIGPTWQKMLRTHAAQVREKGKIGPHPHRRRVQPLLNYIGSKSRVIDTLIAAFPTHRTYVEVFCGSACLTFAKTPSKIEVINDLDDQVFNLFHVIRTSPDALAAMVAAAPRTRELFEKLEKMGPELDCNVAKAFRTLYIGCHGYLTGQQRAQYFPACRTSPQRWGSMELASAIYRWSERFSMVTVENLDFAKLIDRYDSPDCFFFCDSPYPELEHYYRTTFEAHDHARLADKLKSITGKALVTLPNLPEVRALYDGWAKTQPLPIRYSISAKKVTGDELMIFVNYNPPSKNSGPGDLFDHANGIGGDASPAA